MKIIGVTGPSGSGKTLFGEYFSKLGIPVINADEVYHGMLVPPSECLDAIKGAFGESVISSDGSLDRSVLSSIVFNDKAKLALLNETVLDIVIKEIRRQVALLEKQRNRAVIIDAPTLIESGLYKDCDRIVSVISSKEMRIKRISERDGIAISKAKERVDAQCPDSFYIEASDIVLENNGTEEEFTLKLSKLAEEII